MAIITTIILITLIALGIRLYNKNDPYSYIMYDFYGFVICLIFGTWLIIHIVGMAKASYEYELFVQRRNAFEQTLNSARENGNQYETAAIVKEVAEWNTTLATEKFYNKTAWFDQYIDDRIETLEPIK